MIVSASYRTDIPAFYGRWFMARLDAGFCRTINPYGRQTYEVSLRREDVDGFVFWTRNIGPFLDPLREIARRGIPFIVQYTITGYPNAVETSVIESPRAITQMQALRMQFGAHVAVWRYDPILVSELTQPDWHRTNFARIAKELEGVTDEVAISFAQIYRKTERNLNTAARVHGFQWRDPEDEEKRALTNELAAIADSHGMRLSICTQPELLVAGTVASRCVDAARLSAVAGREIAARAKGNRPGCLCAESRDIGEYDTCPHGCVYCYAVSSRAAARRRHKAHDPMSEFLYEPEKTGA